MHGEVTLSRSHGRLRRRLVRELVPGLIGIGAAALITANASYTALGVILPPTGTQAAVCSPQPPPLAPRCPVQLP
jgi:hypothetical protein